MTDQFPHNLLGQQKFRPMRFLKEIFKYVLFLVWSIVAVFWGLPFIQQLGLTIEWAMALGLVVLFGPPLLILFMIKLVRRLWW